MTTDIHQHLLPSAVLDELRRRTSPPHLNEWTLRLAGEPPYRVDPADHDPDRRALQARADGLETAVVSLSSALGIESLPTAEAAPLLDAYHEGALALPAPFRAWAAARLAQPDPDELKRLLELGFVGLQLPATALGSELGLARAAPLLDVLEQRDHCLFVHPGPATATPQGDAVPAWWPALVDYVQQMHAAWFAFRLWGRPRHPRLRVCFAMLAGLAPLHGERLAARAGLRTIVDEHTFLEISSYGTRAVDAVVRALGIDGLVNGSDRPYAEPVVPELGDAALHLLRDVNPARLLAAAGQPTNKPLKEVSDDRVLAPSAQP